MSTIKHTASFEIRQPANELFPLFSPEGEKLWIPGWDYENVMGGTDLHEDYVFITRRNDHVASDAIWVIKKYEPENYLVQYYKVEPGEKIGVIGVRCLELNSSRTEVQVTYEYIGLSTAGNNFVSSFSSSEYNSFIAKWETLLLSYFATKR